MMNRNTLILVTGLLAALAFGVNARDYSEIADPLEDSIYGLDDFADRGRVVQVDPVYEAYTVNRPTTECWTEQHSASVARPDRRVAAGIIGGILGGVAGHQVGHGRRRNAATAAGSILGAVIGYNAAGRNTRYQEPAYYDKKVCETVDRPVTEERISGYRVEYEYQNQIFVIHTERHPGRWVPLTVNVTAI